MRLQSARKSRRCTATRICTPLFRSLCDWSSICNSIQALSTALCASIATNKEQRDDGALWSREHGDCSLPTNLPHRQVHAFTRFETYCAFFPSLSALRNALLRMLSCIALFCPNTILLYEPRKLEIPHCIIAWLHQGVNVNGIP